MCIPYTFENKNLLLFRQLKTLNTLNGYLSTLSHIYTAIHRNVQSKINLEVRQLDIKKAAGLHIHLMNTLKLKRGKGLIQLNLWKRNKSNPCCRLVTSCLCCRIHSVSLQWGLWRLFLWSVFAGILFHLSHCAWFVLSWQPCRGCCNSAKVCWADPGHIQILLSSLHHINVWPEQLLWPQL